MEGPVKTVLTCVALALGVYQVLLAANGYGKLPVIGPRAAMVSHRAIGDTIAFLIAGIATACLVLYGFDEAGHALLGLALVVVLAAKITVVRRGGRLSAGLPLFGLTVLTLLALTLATSEGFDD